MPLNSVNTNMGAMVALQSLNRTTDAMEATQKRISTGYRVADAKDDGAAFAVAQTVRADIAGLTSANEQLGGVQGILDTTHTALKNVSGVMAKLKDVLVDLAADTTNGDQRVQYTNKFNDLVNEVNRYLADATYNGRSLLATDDNAATATNLATVRNENAETFTIAATNTATLTFDQRVNLTTGGTTATADSAFGLVDASGPPPAATPMSAAAARAILGSGPAGDLPRVRTGTGTAAGVTIKTFDTVMSAVNTAMNRYGNDSNYIKAQITYNKDKLDAVESGLGALIDADLAKESARLQALQIRQQLGTQSLGIANQTPQALLSLFKG